MSDEKSYQSTIDTVCKLLQSDPTPEVIQGLRESFESLTKQLQAGPFLEIFEATLSSIPFSALFSLLAAPDNKLIVIVSELTSLLLKPVTWAMVHQTFEEYIIQGLTHPHPVVKTLVLAQFLKCNLETDPFSPNYAPHIWRCLEDRGDSESTRLATQVLLYLCKYEKGMDYVFTDESLAVIKQILGGKESDRFKVYDIVVSITSGSDTAFELFRQEGVVDTFLNEAKSDDILVQINFYELVPDICDSELAADYIEKQGVFKDAFAYLSVDSEESGGITGSLLRTSCLKLFSRAVDSKGVKPRKLLEKYHVTKAITNMLLNHESTRHDVTVTAINCLGAIGNNAEALEYLGSEKNALGAFAKVYNESTGPLRVECLKAIACIFGHSTTPTEPASQACYDFYMHLSDGQFLPGVMKEIIKGFDESCIAAFAVIQKMSYHAWGVREIASLKNVVNFLLTRNTARSKVVQQWQYSAVEALVQAPSAKEAFDNESYIQMKQYLNEGPLYVKVTPQVAMETS